MCQRTFTETFGGGVSFLSARRPSPSHLADFSRGRCEKTARSLDRQASVCAREGRCVCLVATIHISVADRCVGGAEAQLLTKLLFRLAFKVELPHAMHRLRASYDRRVENLSC